MVNKQASGFQVVVLAIALAAFVGMALKHRAPKRH